MLVAATPRPIATLAHTFAQLAIRSSKATTRQRVGDGATPMMSMSISGDARRRKTGPFLDLFERLSHVLERVTACM